MPRRSTSAAEKGDETPVERRVTRGSLRKSVDGTTESASPEKQKPAEKTSATEVKASPSGKKRGRPPKRQSNVDDVTDQTADEGAKMEVDEVSKKPETETKHETAEVLEADKECSADVEKEESAGESKKEESTESKKRQREEDHEDGEEEKSKKYKSNDSVSTDEVVAVESKDETGNAAETMETTTAEETKSESVKASENSGKVEESSVPADVDGEKAVESESKKEQTETNVAENGDQASDANEKVPTESEKPVESLVADIPVCKTAVSSESASEDAKDVVDGVKQNGCHEDVPAGVGC